MLALLISITVSAALAITGLSLDMGTGATVAMAIAGLILPQLGIGLVLRRKTSAVTEELQNMMLKGQKQLQMKMNQFQFKQAGNPKMIQRQLERDQQELCKKALAFTDRFEPFRKWNLLMNKQISTMRMQFLYQLKEFGKVDELLAQNLLKRPMLMEPMLVAMKMARQFKNDNAEGAEKTFKRHVKWFRGDRGTLLYALMSWIYMKQGESEKARELLLKGKEVTADEVLARNWEMLSNGKDKSFSNSGLGEEWFGLHLEPLPAPKQKRVRMKGRRM